MRQITSLVLASLATLAAAGTSQAAVFGPVSTSLGAIRNVMSVNQNQTGPSNSTSFLTVQRCSGVVEYPAFVLMGSAAVATTADYQIALEILSPTQTRVSIWGFAACDIASVTFGSPNSRCGYDMSRPNPGTPGSMAGASPVAVTLVGAWTSSIAFTNAVQVPGTPARGDLYAQMRVSFSSCFDVNDILQFTVDTDILN
jgi:hypothetical protein